MHTTQEEYDALQNKSSRKWVNASIAFFFHFIQSKEFYKEKLIAFLEKNANKSSSRNEP